MGIRRLIHGKGRRALALLAAAGLLAACAGLVLKLRPDLAVRAELRLGRLAGGIPLTPVDYGEPWLNLVPLSSIRQGKTSYTYSWDLLLINPDHPLPADAAIPLSPYKDSGLSFYTGLNQPLSRLIQTVREETGDTLYVASGLRSAEEQAAEYRADPALAMPPGASEHQSGLALDVYVEGYAGYGFLKSAAGRYVNKECWREGFVIRYPDGGEDETGAPFEPWHLRYVGSPHARNPPQERLDAGGVYRAARTLPLLYGPAAMSCAARRRTTASCGFPSTGKRRGFPPTIPEAISSQERSEEIPGPPLCRASKCGIIKRYSLRAEPSGIPGFQPPESRPKQ